MVVINKLNISFKIIVCQQLARLTYQTKCESEEEMQLHLCRIYSSVSSPINLKVTSSAHSKSEID